MSYIAVIGRREEREIVVSGSDQTGYRVEMVIHEWHTFGDYSEDYIDGHIMSDDRVFPHRIQAQLEALRLSLHHRYPVPIRYCWSDGPDFSELATRTLAVRDALAEFAHTIGIIKSRFEQIAYPDTDELPF